MKKIFLAVSIIALLIGACNKTKPTIENPTVSPTVKIGKKTRDVAGAWGIHREFYGFAKACYPPKKNCYDEVVVHGVTLEIAVGYFNQGSIGVSDYFNSNNWQNLLPDLDIETLTELQSGNYEIAVDVADSMTFLRANNIQTGINDQFVFPINIK